MAWNQRTVNFGSVRKWCKPKAERIQHYPRLALTIVLGFDSSSKSVICGNGRCELLAICEMEEWRGEMWVESPPAHQPWDGGVTWGDVGGITTGSPTLRWRSDVGRCGWNHRRLTNPEMEEWRGEMWVESPPAHQPWDGGVTWGDVGGITTGSPTLGWRSDVGRFWDGGVTWGDVGGITAGSPTLRWRSDVGRCRWNHRRLTYSEMEEWRGEMWVESPPAHQLWDGGVTWGDVGGITAGSPTLRWRSDVGRCGWNHRRLTYSEMEEWRGEMWVESPPAHQLWDGGVTWGDVGGITAGSPTLRWRSDVGRCGWNHRRLTNSEMEEWRGEMWVESPPAHQLWDGGVTWGDVGGITAGSPTLRWRSDVGRCGWNHRRLTNSEMEEWRGEMWVESPPAHQLWDGGVTRGDVGGITAGSPTLRWRSDVGRCGWNHRRLTNSEMEEWRGEMWVESPPAHQLWDGGVTRGDVGGITAGSPTLRWRSDVGRFWDGGVTRGDVGGITAGSPTLRWRSDVGRFWDGGVTRGDVGGITAGSPTLRWRSDVGRCGWNHHRLTNPEMEEWRGEMWVESPPAHLLWDGGVTWGDVGGITAGSPTLRWRSDEGRCGWNHRRLTYSEMEEWRGEMWVESPPAPLFILEAMWFIWFCLLRFVFYLYLTGQRPFSGLCGCKKMKKSILVVMTLLWDKETFEISHEANQNSGR